MDRLYFQHMDKIGKAALVLLSLMVVVGILATGWRFFIEKQYDFVVESSCNPDSETCFYRDCSVEGDCPPNGLELYKTYVVSAADFKQCSDNSCETQCADGSIECELVACGSSEEDECYAPEGDTSGE